MVDGLIVSETCFADYEEDRAVQKRLYGRWVHGIRTIAELQIPEGWNYVSVLYVSEDKEDIKSSLLACIDSMPISLRSRFMVVEYSHPAGGYGLPDTHPDLVKNPNKHSPERDRLFDRAIASGLHLEGYGRIARIALDDDDVWLPWHLHNIVSAIEAIPGNDFATGIGFSDVLVGYVFGDQVKVEQARFSRMMTGNKFYAFSGEGLARIGSLHPWGIPERFYGAELERFMRVGVELRVVDDVNPGWIYMRWGDNLSNADKRSYYLDPPLVAYSGSRSNMITGVCDYLQRG